ECTRPASCRYWRPSDDMVSPRVDLGVDDEHVPDFRPEARYGRHASLCTVIRTVCRREVVVSTGTQARAQTCVSTQARRHRGADTRMGGVGVEPTTLGLKVPCSAS